MPIAIGATPFLLGIFLCLYIMTLYGIVPLKCLLVINLIKHHEYTEKETVWRYESKILFCQQVNKI
jgi:nitrate reductase gamma subunit